MSPGSAMCSLNCKPTWAASPIQGLGAQVLAIELQQVEGKQEHSTILPPVAQSIKARQAATSTFAQACTRMISLMRWCRGQMASIVTKLTRARVRSIG